MRRYETLGLEDRIRDLPHSWETNPKLCALRGRLEDLRRLLADFKALNPCASDEEVKAERVRICADLDGKPSPDSNEIAAPKSVRSVGYAALERRNEP